MEIKKLLEIESIISGRKTPSDMFDDSLNAHYSKSRGEEIKILDMHLPHLIRAYSNLLNDCEYFHTVEVMCMIVFYEMIHRTGNRCPSIKQEKNRMADSPLRKSNK